MVFENNEGNETAGPKTITVRQQPANEYVTTRRSFYVIVGLNLTGPRKNPAERVDRCAAWSKAVTRFLTTAVPIILSGVAPVPYTKTKSNNHHQRE